MPTKNFGDYYQYHPILKDLFFRKKKKKKKKEKYAYVIIFVLLIIRMLYAFDIAGKRDPEESIMRSTRVDV